MSHIHIPDGVLPIWLWVLGYILIGMYYIFAVYYVNKHKKQTKFPLISVMAALMLLTMSIPIPFPVPYHVNLAVLSGIILGPVLSFFAIFTTNLLLAFTSHGGITSIGLNTIVISTEAAFGYFIFKFFLKQSNKVFLSAFIATFLALIISTALNIGIVYTGTHDFSLLAHHHHHNEPEIYKHKPIYTEVLPEHFTQEAFEQHGHQTPYEHHEEKFSIKKFFSLMFIFGLIGWMLEASLTGFIVNYINKVKPEILNINNK